VIRTEDEYRVGLRRVEESKRAIADTHAALQQQGLDVTTIDMFLASMRVLQRDVQDEVVAYEKARDFDFGPVPFTGLGRLLIGLRIGRHMSVSDLAEALDVDKGNVSRDEKNDYRGITRDRIARILAALNVELMIVPVRKEMMAMGAQDAAPRGQVSVTPPSAVATWAAPPEFVPEQPMVWPAENVQQPMPYGYGALYGYVQVTNGGVGGHAQMRNPAVSQPAHANVASHSVLAEAA